MYIKQITLYVLFIYFVNINNIIQNVYYNNVVHLFHVYSNSPISLHFNRSKVSVEGKERKTLRTRIKI